MTLHRPTNLMGTAACHEAGERPASPIAPGTKPLTAEERAARRKRHEEAQRPLVDYVALALEHYRSVQKEIDALERASAVHIGIDTAKPGSETVVIVKRQQSGMFWHVLA